MPTEIEGTHRIQLKTLQGVSDVSLYTKTWKPDTPPKAILIFIHGFNDHINRYYELFPTLASRGIETHAFDQRGWGASVKSPKDKGKTGPTSLVISDIVSFMKTVLPSSVPVFVLAHSMGGGEAIMLMSDPKYEDLMPSIRGWLLESPFIGFPKGEEPNFLTVFFGRLAGKVLPHKQMFSPIPAEKCTRDPAVIAELNGDELLHGTGTLEGLAGMLDRTALIGDRKTVLNKGVKSIWLGHGTEDFGTSYPASKKWFEEQKGVQDKEFKTYEGWSHQLHADLADNRSIFANDVADWILARCGEAKGDGSKL